MVKRPKTDVVHPIIVLDFTIKNLLQM